MDSLLSTTINIGILFDKGAILLADSQASAGTKYVGDVQKIFHLADNVLMSISGDMGFAQKTMRAMQTDIIRLLAYYDQAIKNHEAATIKEMEECINKGEKAKEEKQKGKEIKSLKAMSKEAKKLLFSKEEFYLSLIKDTLYNNPDIKRELDGSIKNKEGAYVMQKFGLNLAFEVGSVASQVAKRIDSSKPLTGIIAGYDKQGPKLFEVYANGAFIQRDKYSVAGSGATDAAGPLGEFYREKMPKEEALMLTVYSGLRAAEKDIGVNDTFQIALVELNEEGIITPSLLKSEEIEALKGKAKAAKQKLSF